LEERILVLEVYEELVYTVLLNGAAEEGGEEWKGIVEGFLLGGGGLVI
jgi:hypothetical protein